MDITEALFGFVTGLATSLAPRLFRSKKENDEILIALVKALQAEVQRMHNDLKMVREEYDLKLIQVQSEYDELLKKYNGLKKDFLELKKQKPN